MNCQLIGPSRSPNSDEPLSHETSDRFTGAGQHFAVGTIARCLDRKDETFGRLFAPIAPVGGFESRIIGSVDLDRRKAPAGELEFALLSQFRRIENATPRFVGPTADTDMDFAFHDIRDAPGHDSHSKSWMGDNPFGAKVLILAPALSINDVSGE